MDIFLFILIVLTIIIFFLVFWTIYEFVRLDKELFKFYIIGLILYGICLSSFFLRYIVLPPLTEIESTVLGYGLSISPLIGIFYFIKGTEYLAQQENPNFHRNEVLYKSVFYAILITSLYVIPLQLALLVVSDTTMLKLTIVSYPLYIIAAFLALKLMLEYKKAFSDPIDKIVYQYTLAALLLIIGGVIALVALQPIETGDVFTDLSYSRKAIGIIGEIIIVIPYIIFLKSISKFRKALMG